jgi:hypothetical protein
VKEQVMSLSKLLFRVVLVFACAAPFALSAHAQFKASIQGTVQDANGGVVAGAKVTISNQETGIEREAATSDQGFYRVNELPPGHYTVIVEAPGFKQAVLKDVLVEAEQPRGLDVTLAVGQVQDSVTVSATPGGLETENASIISTIGSQEVLTLPQFGRDPFELIRLNSALAASLIPVRLTARHRAPASFTESVRAISRRVTPRILTLLLAWPLTEHFAAMPLAPKSSKWTSLAPFLTSRLPTSMFFLYKRSLSPFGTGRSPSVTREAEVASWLGPWI